MSKGAAVPRHGNVFVWNLKTGDRLERPSVDANEMVTKYPDDWTREDPEEGKGSTAPEAATGRQVQEGLQKGEGEPVIPGAQAEKQSKAAAAASQKR